MAHDESTPIISLTRLRLAASRFLVPFVWLMLRAGWQARATAGFAGMRLLMDGHLVFWTATAWSSTAGMRAFRDTGAHKAAMRRLPEWCDEASVARWSAPAVAMADWRSAHARMVTEGRRSFVRHPSPLQATGQWPEPRLHPRRELVLLPVARRR